MKVINKKIRLNLIIINTKIIKWIKEIISTLKKSRNGVNKFNSKKGKTLNS